MDPNVVTLIGALGGTALGGLLTLTVEALRWRRDRAERWDGDRRRTYASFLTAAVRFSNAVDDWAYARVTAEDSDETRARALTVESTHAELLPPLFELRLLARHPLVLAAEQLKAALDTQWTTARSVTAENYPEVQLRWAEEWDRLRDGVISAAKDELGVAFEGTAAIRALRPAGLPNVRWPGGGDASGE